MAQVNINNTDPTPTYTEPTPIDTNRTPTYSADPSGAHGAATSNLTWAIAVVLIIAALAIAIVYVSHNVHI